MKLKYAGNKIELVTILCAFFCIAWLTTFNAIGYVVATLLLIAVIIYILLKIVMKQELSVVIAIPIMLSVFQNVYLGIFATELTNFTLQLLTILNFLLSCIILVALLFLNKYTNNITNTIIIMIATLIFYGVISLFFCENINFIAIISSLRNMLSVFIFFLLGSMISHKLNMKKFQEIIIFLGIISILFGLYEKFIAPDIWKKLNITELWNKKGIAVQPSGLPTNFYSSETIKGERIRRMTSTFADPVNFGTFIFAIFCLAWFNNKKTMMILAVLAMALTVSKGALLGILIFICVYSFFYHRKIFIVLSCLMLGIGVAFLVYAYKISANSVFLHISGLTSAIVSVIHNPLGYGLGSVGVISKQFSGYSAKSDITETGFGMIIGQLGMIGFLIYVLYFKMIIKKVCLIEDKKEKVFNITLLISIIVNILFNEVALSPNSCALYFIIIGFYVSNNENNKTENIIVKEEIDK